MAQARRFKITLKDSPTAPATYQRGAHKFTRGSSIETANLTDADYFDAQEEFQVQELTAPAPAEKPAAPKGRFSRMAPAAPAAAQEAEPEDEDAEYDPAGDEEGESEEPAEEAAPASAELEQALKGKGKGGKGKGGGKKAAG
jgi:hypothetical protein